MGADEQPQGAVAEEPQTEAPVGSPEEREAPEGAPEPPLAPQTTGGDPGQVDAPPAEGDVEPGAEGAVAGAMGAAADLIPPAEPEDEVAVDPAVDPEPEASQVDDLPDEEPPEGYARGRVIIGVHLYFYDDEHGKRQQQKARRGALLELPVAEIERGFKIGALGPPEEPSPGDALDPLKLTDEQLAQWVARNSSEEVVAHAVDVEAANRLLEAEHASGADPRAAVLQGIEAILARG